MPLPIHQPKSIYLINSSAIVSASKRTGKTAYACGHVSGGVTGTNGAATQLTGEPTHECVVNSRDSARGI